MKLSARTKTIVKATAFVLSILVPTVAGLWPFWRQSDKALEYAIVSVSPLGPSQASGFRDLKLLKGNKPIDQPYLATVRFTNVGAVPIPASDFESPLYIRTATAPYKAELTKGQYPWLVDFKGLQGAGRTAVIDARVARVNPSNLMAKLTIENDAVQVAPLLLNASDELEIELLLSGGLPLLEADARIAGIKTLQRERPDLQSTNKRLVAANTLQVVFAIAVAYLFWAHTVFHFGNAEWVFRRPVGIVFFLVSMVAYVVSFARLEESLRLEPRSLNSILLLLVIVVATGVTMITLRRVLSKPT